MMTDKEIKLELTKTAMATGMSIEMAQKFYEWIVKESDSKIVSKYTQFDDTPIEELAYKTRIEGTIIKRCKENNINTVGELIHCGAHKFRTFRLVGRGTVRKINNALQEYFGISDWYTT